jgi:hypothetical protein
MPWSSGKPAGIAGSALGAAVGGRVYDGDRRGRRDRLQRGPSATEPVSPASYLGCGKTRRGAAVGQPGEGVERVRHDRLLP